MSEERYAGIVPVMDVGNVEDVISVVSKDQEEIIPEINEVVPKPQGASLRRYSTGMLGPVASKRQVQSRYRGNHHVGSTHDLCKQGKRCDQDDAVKPWKMTRRKSVEGSDVTKVENSSLTRKLMGSPSTKPESPMEPWKMARRKSVGGSGVTKVETSSLTRKVMASPSKQIPSPKPESPMEPWKMARRKSVQGSGVTKVESSSLTRKSMGSPSRQILSTKPESPMEPWKMARRKSVEGSGVTKVETSSLTRKSMGSPSRQILSPKQESPVALKRDALVVKRKPCTSVNSESSSKEGSEIARSVDGSSVKSNDRARKNEESEIILSDLGVFKKVHGLKNEKTDTGIEKVHGLRHEKSDTGIEKVSGINDAESSKVKAKTQRISSEDVKEDTVCVVEYNVKGVKSEKQPSSEKKSMRSRIKSLATPKHGSSPIKPPLGNISTGLTKKKENGSVDLEAEKQTRPKRKGVKVTLTKQLSIKKGKVIEPKRKDSSARWIKKRIMQELNAQTEGMKKNLKDKKLDVETESNSCEGSESEKIVLRHQKVQGRKKVMTLFNNLIEETVDKFMKTRKGKGKVKALVSAFESVISLQDTNKSSHKTQSKDTTSE